MQRRHPHDDRRITATTIDTGHVRTLQPSNRHRTILKGFAALDPGETVRLVNDRDPAPMHRTSRPVPLRIHRSWTRTLDGRLDQPGPDPRCWRRGVRAITQAAASARDDELLVVYTPFEPVLLEGALHEQRFRHVADQIDDDTWQGTFVRP